MDTVKTEATFLSDDIFHRIKYAQLAMSLIKTYSPAKGACSIAIDSAWGMGKTTLLRMWINELEQNNGVGYQYNKAFTGFSNRCIYYNAWENDYYGNAFIPFVHSVCGNLAIEKKNSAEWVNKTKDLLKSLVTKATAIAASMLCASSTNNPMLAAATGEMVQLSTNTAFQLFEGNDPEEIAKEFELENKKREEFRSVLSDITELAGTLFIFVDELDRCRPSLHPQFP